MGFIFGGDTGQSQESVTDARKRLAAAMLQQGTNTGPIQSPWEGAARMAQALMGGLAIRKQGEAEQAGMAEGMAALTGQPYTPPEKPAGFLSSIFGGNKAGDPGATGSSMPKVDAGGNIPVATAPDDVRNLIAANVPPEMQGYATNLIGKESSFNPNAVSPTGATGLAQFTRGTGSQYGLVSDRGDMRKDPVANLKALVALTNDNRAGLMNALGRAPTDGELALAHQQGLQGAINLLSGKSVPGNNLAVNNIDPNSDPRAAANKIMAFYGGSGGQQSAQAAGMPSASPIQPPPVNPPAPPPQPGYVDPMIAPNAAPPIPQQTAVPGEVASLDPSIGIPMPGAAGQMRASAPAQPIAPQGVPQAALSPLPTSAVGPTPNVASVPPVGMPSSQILPEFQNSPQLMNADPNKGILTALLSGSPASPEQVQQAQAFGQNQPAPARLAAALDGASPQQTANPMANPRAQALAKVLMNPNVPAPMKQMAAQTLQTLMRPPEYGFQTLPDGTVLRSDPRSGTLTPVYRSEMSQADQAKLDFEREKFRQEQENRGTMTAADQAKIDLERQKSDFDRNKPVVVQPGETLFSPGQERVVYQGTGYKPEDVSNLRKEVQNLPTYKSYQQAAPVYHSMIDTAKTDSKASDLNLVYGLGKIMDPTSVVREGEMVMVNNTASLPDWFSGIINSVNGGQRLTPETRQAILSEARSRMGAYRGALDNDIGQYRGIIGRRGMNEADVLPTLGDIEEVPNLSPSPAADVGAPPEGVPADVWGAMTPAERKLWQR
ncbi:transglycosylase SLT domain-containing protein [Rhizobium laguerreae]|uniref:transglycosylase SLT domain-containing protein n=1 Tax=Rhizobium laguerreae TaxID=1076926 RepID=UPI0021B0CC6D|nr:transglycosylase SLT domain-containing protein [Rhizobium laguerreae]